jgi:type IV secretion system protein TrbL
MAGFPEVFVNIDPIVVLFIAWLVVILCFFVLAVQLFITLIEFKLTTLAGFVLIPFALWNKTSFLAEKVLGNVVSSGIKVLVLAVIVGIGSGLFAEFQVHPDEPSIDHALVVMLASLALLALGIFGPGIATGLVSGAPQLGAGAMAGAAVGAVGTGVAIGAAATGVGGAVMAGARMAPAAAKLAGAGACRDFGGRQCPIGVPGRFRRCRRRCQGRGGWPRQCRQDRRTSRRPQRHLWCFRCWAEGGRLLPRWLERHRSRQRRCWPRPDRRRHRRLAEARATGLGQADAPPPAGYPCRDHRRPHAARGDGGGSGQGPSLRDSDT